MGSRINEVIGFKMGLGMATELLSLYENDMQLWEGAEDAHEQLLGDHLRDMYVRIQRICLTMGKTATLSMTHSEATAFMQTWNNADLRSRPLANTLIRDMIGKIDKRQKSALWARR